MFAAEKTNEKKTKFLKKKKKNVYEKPIKSNQDGDIAKITYSSSYLVVEKKEEEISQARDLLFHLGLDRMARWGENRDTEGRHEVLCIRSEG